MKYVTMLFVLIPFYSISQKVYSVDYANQADIKVFEVQYENQCDLKVFKVDNPNQVDGNRGLWHFVDYANQSELKVFFVQYQNQAGWREKSKQHLIY